MGYTHYCYVEKELDKTKFQKVAEDFKKMLPVLEHVGVKIAGPNGEGNPIIDEKEIAFNGLEKCGHQERDLGRTWPADNAKGVANLSKQHMNGNQTMENVEGKWFAGLQLNTRTCGGDCSHETFRLDQVHDPEDLQKPAEEVSYINADGTPHYRDKRKVGRYFEFCKTAYKPYDLAVNICMIIAKHYLKDQIIMHSDGEIEQWKDAMQICQHFLGYGEDFKLDESEES